MQISNIIKTKLLLAIGVTLGLLFTPVFAAAAPILTQSFIADGGVPMGSIVSLQKGSEDRIERSTLANVNQMIGVVVQAEDSQISISAKSGNQFHVAADGIEQVLVSDINGNILAGDSITASPISGVGMKATSNSKVVGIAQDNFPNSTAAQQEYKDAQGQQQTVKLGQIPVAVNISYFYKQPDKSIVPPAIQNLADALAGKKVNSLPILISIGIFISTLIVVASIIYSMIRSSIISVGRNPMSQSAIYRNVMQISALVLGILIVAVGSIYMVLTRF